MSDKVLDCGLTQKELNNVVEGKDNILTSSIVIKRINVKRGTFEKMVRTGKFPEPKMRINGHPRWLTSQVTQWLNNCSEVTVR